MKKRILLILVTAAWFSIKYADELKLNSKTGRTVKQVIRLAPGSVSFTEKKNATIKKEAGHNMRKTAESRNFFNLLLLPVLAF